MAEIPRLFGEAREEIGLAGATGLKVSELVKQLAAKSSSPLDADVQHYIIKELQKDADITSKASAGSSSASEGGALGALESACARD